VILLLLVGFLGGLVTGISPCILPVLPVIFASGAAAGLDDARGTDDEVTLPAPGVVGVPTGALPAERRVPAAVAAGTTPETVGGGAPLDRAAGDPVATGTGPGQPASDAAAARRRLAATRRARRPFAVVGGLVLSFSLATLAGTWLLGALGLPYGLLRWVGIVAVGLLGVGLLVPQVGDLLERPFARVASGHEVREGGGFVLGASLGLVFVPCAGPVLATITAVGGSHRVGWSAVLLTAAFAAGVAVPLLAFALAGRYLGARMRAVRTHAATVRRVIGAVLLATAVVLALGVTDGVQRAVPGYTNALQNRIEGNPSVTRDLRQVQGETTVGALADCTPASPVLQRCGPAPAFAGISRWLQTPGDRPLTVAGLRGRVVLVDFWTYSCINCQRALPHVEAWNATYAAAGLTVVGVHTPEFAFEHDVGNITRAAAQLGVRYPIAVDNSYATWNGYQNSYWPAEYLIDATGTVRHVDVGEGQYAQTESFIRQLLVTARPGVVLPPRTDVPDSTPHRQTTPESYLGYHYSEANLYEESVTPDAMVAYHLPGGLPQDTFAFGGRWDIGSEGAVAGADATLSLQYQAQDVYLVLGGSGTVAVAVDGVPTRSVHVAGEPRLYRLVGPGPFGRGTLTLDVPPGVEAYDFTFG
jgi:cytochrome c biogenesis protein CcdA/thiol-disulfide isomerase/thioredoxin